MSIISPTAPIGPGIFASRRVCGVDKRCSAGNVKIFNVRVSSPSK